SMSCLGYRFESLTSDRRSIRGRGVGLALARAPPTACVCVRDAIAKRLAPRFQRLPAMVLARASRWEPASPTPTADAARVDLVRNPLIDYLESSLRLQSSC